MVLSYFKAPVRNQFITIFIVNIVIFIYGSILGWFSPALISLSSPETPLAEGPLTKAQTSILAVTLSVFAIIGAPVCSLIISRYGFRVSLICLAIPQIIWWLLIMFGDRFVYLVIARAFAGYTGGAYLIVLPQFTADVVQKEIRGMCGIITSLMVNLGQLFGFLLGNYCDYHEIPYSIVLPIVYILLVILYVPESMPYLLRKGKEEKAYKSLMHYRTVKPDGEVQEWIRDDFADLKKMQSYLQKQVKVSWRTLLTKEIRFGLLISLFLSVLYHMSGTYTLMQFAAPILKISKSSVAPKNAALIPATLQIMGNCVSFALVDRIGRKILILTSCLGAAISLATLGIYTFLDEQGHDVKYLGWIPVASFSAAIFSLWLGVASAPFTVLAELIPPEVKNMGFMVTAAVTSATGALCTGLFPILVAEIHLHGVMWVFACASVIGFLVCIIWLPETKGKNLHKVE